MGTVETRSTQTLGSSREPDKIESPKEKTLDLTEKRDDSVAVEEGQENGFSDSGEANVEVKDGVSLVENENKPEDDEDDDDDDDVDGNGFTVGDFVWGKIKSHPWWPGQIYDPINVSEFAAKIKHKAKHHLVAYFGDGTFAWCESSQLKPFEESFDEMSKQSVAKGFVAAVQQAVDEIARVLESNTTCSCVPEQNKARLGRLVAGNAGVKEGSLVPEGKIRIFSDVLAEPSELLEALKRIARSGRYCSVDVVELGILTSRVSSFYRSKGVLELPQYRDPVSVPGLEDRTKRDVEIRAQGPSEEDWHPQADQPFLRSCPSSSGNKRNPRRKQRSIADLIATEGTSSDEKKKKKKRASSPSSEASKKRKRGDEEDLVGDGLKRLLSSAAKASKKTSLPLGSRLSTRIRDIAGAEKDSEIEDGDSAAKKSFEKSPSYREKKRSKYLSPPFTDSNGGKRKKNAEMTELPKVVSADEDQNRDKIVDYQKKADVSTNDFLSEVRSTAADPCSQRGKKSAEMVSDFISVYRDSVYCNGSGDGEEKTPRPRKRKRKISKSESPNQPADESPETKQSSAADKSEEKRVKTRGRKKKQMTETPEAKTIGKSPETNQSSAAEKSEEKRVKKRGRKKKQVPETPEAKEMTPNSSAADKSNDKKRVETRGRKKKQKQETETPEAEKKTASKEEAPKSADGVKSRGRKKKKKPESETSEAKNKEIIDEKILPATLIVEFAPASILPSKADLIGMYDKYGDLDKGKTDMYYANQCARIYFLNGSEAQIAYTESKAASPFGSNSVEFILECPSREYKTRVLQEINSGKKKKTPKKASKGKGESELGFVKSKLETISSMLDEKDGKMSPTMKSKLKGEISGLLEKVSSMVV